MTKGERKGKACIVVMASLQCEGLQHRVWGFVGPSILFFCSGACLLKGPVTTAM